MSSTSSIQLSEEQEKFLNDLEEEFKDRYTENDEEFKSVLNERLPPPPIIENWADYKQRNDRPDRYRFGRHRDFEIHSYERRRDRYYRDDGERYSHSSRQGYRFKM